MKGSCFYPDLLLAALYEMGKCQGWTTCKFSRNSWTCCLNASSFTRRLAGRGIRRRWLSVRKTNQLPLGYSAFLTCISKARSLRMNVPPRKSSSCASRRSCPTTWPRRAGKGPAGLSLRLQGASVPNPEADESEIWLRKSSDWKSGRVPILERLRGRFATRADLRDRQNPSGNPSLTRDAHLRASPHNLDVRGLLSVPSVFCFQAADRQPVLRVEYPMPWKIVAEFAESSKWSPLCSLVRTHFDPEYVLSLDDLQSLVTM